MLKAENHIHPGRLWVANLVIILIMGSLIFRYFVIQIYNHEKYKTQAEVNRIRAVPLNAPRGLVFDRNGTLIVDNFPMQIPGKIAGEKINQGRQSEITSDADPVDYQTADKSNDNRRKTTVGDPDINYQNQEKVRADAPNGQPGTHKKLEQHHTDGSPYHLIIFHRHPVTRQKRPLSGLNHRPSEPELSSRNVRGYFPRRSRFPPVMIWGKSC